MKTEQLMEEIREVNLTYLMLAQNMIRQDKAEAMYRLGVKEEIATILEQLTPGQLLKVAASNMVMCCFRFNDQLVWNLLTSHSKDANAAAIHAGILMAGQTAEVPEHA